MIRIGALMASLCLCVSVLAQEPGKTTKPITLPGVMADGGVRLPNTWSIRPAGKQIELGDFPISIAMRRSQQTSSQCCVADSDVKSINTCGDDFSSDVSGKPIGPTPTMPPPARWP